MPKENNAKAEASRSKAKRIAAVIAASLVGVSVTTVLTTICIYDSFFDRYYRPDYSLYPGMYCYDRFDGRLPRETFNIQSGDNMLMAYYYPAESSRGLVVLAHGFRSGADDYLPLIKAVVERGFSVLTYDVTGVYSSEGDSMIGMCQSLCDIDRVLTFAGKDERFASMPKFVLGHSWGGYAASSVLALHGEIKGAALIAPMNNGATVMLEKGEEHAGKIAYSAKPIFAGYQRMLFGDYVNYNGVVGINSTDVPVLIAQGVDDTVITPNGQSITAHLDELTNPNVTLYWGRGVQGSHTGIWHSVESEEYRQQIDECVKKMEGELDRKLTDSERAEIYSTVDHELYSAVNPELVDLIIQTFEKGLSI